MTRLNYITTELTDEQNAELDAAEGDKEKTEAILRRIADEVIAQKEIEEEPMRKALHEVADKIRYRLFSDVLLGVHWLMHKDRTEEAKELLCPVAAMIEGARPPNEVMEALLRKLDEVNLEREPVEGHA
jgi:hypothetical protein